MRISFGKTKALGAATVAAILLASAALPASASEEPTNKQFPQESAPKTTSRQSNSIPSQESVDRDRSRLPGEGDKSTDTEGVAPKGSGVVARPAPRDIEHERDFRSLGEAVAAGRLDPRVPKDLAVKGTVDAIVAFDYKEAIAKLNASAKRGGKRDLIEAMRAEFSAMKSAALGDQNVLSAWGFLPTGVRPFHFGGAASRCAQHV